MSSTSTTVTSEHFAYLAQRTLREDAFLSELKAAAQAAGIPAIQIAPEQASFMQILLKSARAREVLEVGTLAGYSAIAMARALPHREQGGRLVTVEFEERHADFAEAWIARSDVADRVEVRRGAGSDVLRTLPEHSMDAVFLDADKRGYPDYLEQSLRIVRPGGMILVDNAFAFGELFSESPRDREVQAVREFNEIMSKTTGLHGIIVPIGDGLWVSVVEDDPSSQD